MQHCTPPTHTVWKSSTKSPIAMDSKLIFSKRFSLLFLFKILWPGWESCFTYFAKKKFHPQGQLYLSIHWCVRRRLARHKNTSKTPLRGGVRFSAGLKYFPGLHFVTVLCKKLDWYIYFTPIAKHCFRGRVYLCSTRAGAHPVDRSICRRSLQFIHVNNLVWLFNWLNFCSYFVKQNKKLEETVFVRQIDNEKNKKRGEMIYLFTLQSIIVKMVIKISH